MQLHHAFMLGGGTEGTQCRDAVVGGQSVIEKALDSRTRGVLAQEDIAGCYSNILLGTLGRNFLRRGYGFACTGVAIKAHAR